MKHLVLCLSLFLIVNTYSQNRTCGFDQIVEKYQTENTQSIQKRIEIENHTKNYIENSSKLNSRAVITIPVVVHILYNNSTLNLSDAQILSQIDILNQDFRRLNTDATSTWSQAADSEIEFCLASIDPQGNSTNGITRTSTTVTTFDYNTDNIKVSSSGGKDPWSTSNYLNIWVGNISGSLLGYATPPGFTSSKDGVVIGYRYFGNQGTAQSPYNKGRTCTHEVGHYLNLEHIWGNGCTIDDGVLDTPIAGSPNYGCPSNAFSCGTTDMSENYMDYVDDGCMNLFTSGQKTRMQALFTVGGARASLLNSNVGCNSGGSSGGGVAGSGICSDPYLITCGNTYNGTTSGSSNFNNYSCMNWNESGPEDILALTLTQTENLSISISNLTTDLDLALLNNCSASSCIEMGDNTITASNLSPGTYYIAVDGFGGASGNYSIQATCNSSIISNIPENINEINFNVYPNPADEFVNIDMSNIMNPSKVEIVDVTGKLIYTQIIGENTKKLNINTNDFNSGNYIIQIISKSNIQSTKLIIK